MALVWKKTKLLGRSFLLYFRGGLFCFIQSGFPDRLV